MLSGLPEISALIVKRSGSLSIQAVIRAVLEEAEEAGAGIQPVSGEKSLTPILLGTEA
jgi:hypothetical protein